MPCLTNVNVTNILILIIKNFLSDSLTPYNAVLNAGGTNHPFLNDLRLIFAIKYFHSEKRLDKLYLGRDTSKKFGCILP